MGGITVSEPVQRSTFLTVKRSFPQSKRILPSVSPFNTAVPSTIVIPLEVSRIFTPDVSFLTVRFFRLMILSMSKDGVPSGEMPYLEDVLKLSNILAEYNNVFVGIQPSFRQTPPMAFFSKRTVFRPPSAARSAAV